VHCALYPLRLRVIESSNVIHSYVTGCDVLDRHLPTVGGCRLRATDSGLLNVTDDPAAAFRYRSICAHPSLMSHTTPARRSGRMSSDRSTPAFTGHADLRMWSEWVFMQRTA
jgi:hypothetical protein